MFHHAVALPTADRNHYLDSACGSDAELRREVESLISADATSSPLDISPPPPFGLQYTRSRRYGTCRQNAGLWKQFEGQWVDNSYKLTHLIGLGGFGAVFCADHIVEDQLMRTVAVKHLCKILTQNLI